MHVAKVLVVYEQFTLFDHTGTRNNRSFTTQLDLTWTDHPHSQVCPHGTRVRSAISASNLVSRPRTSVTNAFVMTGASFRELKK